MRPMRKRNALSSCFLQEVFLTSEYICICMEYAAGGSLFDYVKRQGRLTVSD